MYMYMFNYSIYTYACSCNSIIKTFLRVPVGKGMYTVRTYIYM